MLSLQVRYKNTTSFFLSRTYFSSLKEEFSILSPPWSVHRWYDIANYHHIFLIIHLQQCVIDQVTILKSKDVQYPKVFFCWELPCLVSEAVNPHG